MELKEWESSEVKDFDTWLNDGIRKWKSLFTMSRRDPRYLSDLESAHRDLLYAVERLAQERIHLKESAKKELERLIAVNEFEAGCG